MPTIDTGSVAVPIEQLAHGEGLPLPVYQTAGSAGMDLMAAINDDEVLEPGQRRLVATGIRIALPPGSEAQVRPRSGLAVKHGIGMVNAPGTIDSDYRGEIKVCLINHGEAPFTIERGLRIAQLVVAPVHRVTWRTDGALDDTARGAGGFGSTGEGKQGGEIFQAEGSGDRP